MRSAHRLECLEPPHVSYIRSPKRGGSETLLIRPRLWRLTAYVVVVFSFSLSACAMEDTANFDSTTWKAQRGVDLRENKRLAMVDDLEAKLHTGMSRREVLDLLGPPDASDQKKGIDTYELGVSSVGIDGEVYRVEYKDDRLVSHRWSRW